MKRFLRVLSLSSLWVGLVACNPQGSPLATSDALDPAPAGTIGDAVVTVGELDTYIKDALYERETRGGKASKIHELRSQYFDRMAGDRVLEEAAEKQGLAPEALLERESSGGEPIPEESLRSLFEQNKAQLGGRSFEEVAPSIRQHLERSRQQQKMQTYLAGLRDAAGVTFSLEAARVALSGSGPAIGEDNAPVTVVEFSDYQCPYCKQAEPIVEELLERYADKIRFEYRHFPLEEIHPRARPAAEAATCAGAQGRFWDFHRLVFEKSPALSDDELRTYAESLSLDLAAYDACRSESAAREQVDSDLAAGKSAGVEGTPTFFINGISVIGGSIDDFAKVIDRELERVRAGG